MISEVEPKSRQIANVLSHVYNVGRGDVVHILLPNSSQYYFPVFGTWILQQVFVFPADPGLSNEVLARQLEDAGTKEIFCCVNTLEKLKSARKVLNNKIPIVVLDIEEHNMDESVKSLEYLLKLDLTDPPVHCKVVENVRTLICWSSGTTGRPKGIQHGSNLLTNILTETPQETKILQTTCMFLMGGVLSPHQWLGQRRQCYIRSWRRLGAGSFTDIKCCRKSLSSLTMLYS